MSPRIPLRVVSRPFAALLLGLASLACGHGSETSGPSAEVILARDRAADLGAVAEWARASEVLAPLVARPDCAAEDLMRAACAALGNESDSQPAERAQPLVERAEAAGADPAVVLWCRYRMAAVQFDTEAEVQILRRLAALRPDDFTVSLALAIALDDSAESAATTEAETRLRELAALPAERTGAWRQAILFRLATLLRRTGREEASAPFFAEFTRADESGVKNPGTPKHQPGTLGVIPPHTPRAQAPSAPAEPPRALEARTLAGAGGVAIAEVVQLSWAGSPQVAASESVRAEELYTTTPEPVVLVGGPGGVALVRAGATLETKLTTPVLDLTPFDRMNVGATKGTDAQKKTGDMDLDALVLVAAEGASELRLLENVGGTWTLHTEALAKLPAVTGAGHMLTLDYDHDGDVDLLVTTPEGLRLLRNDGLDGSGGFTDASAEAGLPPGDYEATCEDLDRDQDVDLLLRERKSGRLVFLSNERGGRFADHSRELPAGVAGRFAVWADLDGDAWVDLAVFGDDLAIHLRTESGAWRSEVRHVRLDAPPSGAPLALDWNLDGVFDLAWPSERAPVAGLLSAAFEGARAFTLGPAFASPHAGLAQMRAADLDRDGDLDFLRLDAEGLTAWLAPGQGHGTLLAFQGHKDNARGIGAIVELRSGQRYRRFYYRGLPELVGFDGARLDAVRVTWPNGVVQTVFDLAAGESRLIAQRLGQVGSCPFLYTWNGKTYEFVSDVLGITPLGLPMAPGMLVPPDHDEYVLVKGEQLVPKDGFYEMHFTEELREVTYLDRIRLDVVDHPVGTEVFPNERFDFPPFPEPHTHTVRDPLVPLRATDQDGRDWTEALARDDRDFAIPFEALPGPYRGLATPWTLELAFDPARVQSAAQLRLFLDGWFYWTDASVNVAVARHPDLEFVPPILSVPDGAGGWRELGPIGFPAGKLKTMVVDVGAKLERSDPRLRLSSTLRLYWDSIRLAVDADDAPLVTTPLEPLSARLWQRGFSRSFPLLGEHDCEWFEWDALEPQPVWNQHPGLYTRLGNTLPLLTAIDDRFVILGAGDALTVRFDASKTPPLPDGWRRDYLVFLDGWAKDRDPNTLEALHVEPLPFHGMSGFPYRPDEHYPDDPAHRDYRREWNTRPATRWIQPLVPAGGAWARRSETSVMPASSAEAATPIEGVRRSSSASTPAAPATSG